MRRTFGGVVGTLVAFAVVAGAAHASAPPPMRLLATHHGVWRDGHYVLYREGGTPPDYRDAAPVILDARTLAVARRPEPPAGCSAVFFAFRRTLLDCREPLRLGVMDVWSGAITMFRAGTTPLYDDGYWQYDAFYGIGRYWVAGERPTPDDMQDQSKTLYLNIADGTVRVADDWRDIDDPTLPLYDRRICGGSQPDRYKLRFRQNVPGTTDYRDIILVDCRRHTRTTIARCRRGCMPVNPVVDGLALWLSHEGNRLYARRVDGRRTCKWTLPASASNWAFVAGGRVFADIDRRLPQANELRVARPRRC